MVTYTIQQPGPGLAAGPPAAPAVQERRDEVTLYKQARYIGPCAGCWRMWEFKVYGKWPAVLTLQVHLDGQQYVYFQDDGQLAAVSTTPPPKSTLMGWLEFNAAAAAEGRAVGVRYPDMPERHVWNKSTKKWTARQRFFGHQIGRMYSVHPSAGEGFFLRLLLNHVADCASFADIRTFEET
jgi:hypothetical protein